MRETKWSFSFLLVRIKKKSIIGFTIMVSVKVWVDNIWDDHSGQTGRSGRTV